jgi:hypothetical protein
LVDESSVDVGGRRSNRGVALLIDDFRVLVAQVEALHLQIVYPLPEALVLLTQVFLSLLPVQSLALRYNPTLRINRLLASSLLEDELLELLFDLLIFNFKPDVLLILAFDLLHELIVTALELGFDRPLVFLLVEDMACGFLPSGRGLAQPLLFGS